MELIYCISGLTQFIQKWHLQTQPKLHTTHKFIIYDWVHTEGPVVKNTFIKAAQCVTTLTSLRVWGGCLVEVQTNCRPFTSIHCCDFLHTSQSFPPSTASLLGSLKLHEIRRTATDTHQTGTDTLPYVTFWKTSWSLLWPEASHRLRTLSLSIFTLQWTCISASSLDTLALIHVLSLRMAENDLSQAHVVSGSVRNIFNIHFMLGRRSFVLLAEFPKLL